VNSYSGYRRGYGTYEVTYRRDHSTLIKSLRIMAEDDYHAAMLVRDSFLDATIIKITQLS
jgi:hypothetical protein